MQHRALFIHNGDLHLHPFRFSKHHDPGRGTVIEAFELGQRVTECLEWGQVRSRYPLGITILEYMYRPRPSFQVGTPLPHRKTLYMKSQGRSKTDVICREHVRHKVRPMIRMSSTQQVKMDLLRDLARSLPVLSGLVAVDSHRVVGASPDQPPQVLVLDLLIRGCPVANNWTGICFLLHDSTPVKPGILAFAVNLL